MSDHKIFRSSHLKIIAFGAFFFIGTAHSYSFDCPGPACPADSPAHGTMPSQGLGHENVIRQRQQQQMEQQRQQMQSSHQRNHAISSICHTKMMWCNVGRFAPVGTPCWCNSQHGQVPGQIIPQ